MKLTAKETTERNAHLIARRLSDETATWVDIAAEHDVSVKQARRIYDTFKDEIKDDLVRDTTDYLLVVAQKVKQFELIREALWSAARRAALTQPAAQVGALKGIMDVHAREIDLLQKTGLLPNDLGVVRVQLDVRKVTDQFITIFHKYLPADVVDKAQSELLDVLRPSLSRTATQVADVEETVELET